MSEYRIGVYAIALNEEKFVERWFESVKTADHILLADTGSTDNTFMLAKSLGIDVVKINVIPFRFDVARNTALSLLPKSLDFCISLDLDEIVAGNWRSKFLDVRKDTTRLEYRFIHRWNSDGTPARSHVASKIHSRHGYRWINPVHETLVAYQIPEVRQKNEIEIQHFPDDGKSRAGYLPLLEIACQENRDSSQLHFWLAREYLIHGKNVDANQCFHNFIQNFPNAWGPEVAFAYMYLAQLESEFERKFFYLHKSVEIAPYIREPWLKLSELCMSVKDWKGCLSAAIKASELRSKPEIYLLNSDVWTGPKCFDLIALASHFLGDHGTAIKFGEMALQLNSSDLRLQNNLKAYKRSSEFSENRLR